MSLNKLKNHYAAIRFGLIIAILSVLVINSAFPTIASANISEKLTENAVLTRTPEDRMIYPNITKKPNFTVKAIITAYTSTPDQTDDTPFIAASGKHVYDGMIAANWLPMGTKVKIPSLYGNKVFTVHDRMNQRFGYGRMDIWMDATRAQARQFGVKRVEVEIYYPPQAPAQLALAK